MRKYREFHQQIKILMAKKEFFHNIYKKKIIFVIIKRGGVTENSSCTQERTGHLMNLKKKTTIVV